MTMWSSVTFDFPSRCLKLLDLLKSIATDQDCEVTLLVMVASAGLVVPFERLGGAADTWHPSGDDARFKDVGQKLRESLGQKFRKSEFCGDKFQSDWKVRKRCFSADMDDAARKARTRDWHLESPTNLTKEPASMVFACLRNALAHGSFSVHPEPENPLRIGRLAFLSVKKSITKELESFTVFEASVDAIVHLLRTWFDFLKRSGSPSEVLASLSMALDPDEAAA